MPGFQESLENFVVALWQFGVAFVNFLIACLNVLKEVLFAFFGVENGEVIEGNASAALLGEGDGTRGTSDETGNTGTHE